MALRVGLMLVDGAVTVAVVLGVAVLRFRDGDMSALWRSLGIDVRLAAVIFAIVWVAVLWSSGLYRLNVRWRVWTEVSD
ncbi:MAG: hypothetical protein H0W17_05995, partial [Chloroflexi bacterium]|nr:hypothetical protein [Chloroflexota bacterium]